MADPNNNPNNNTLVDTLDWYPEVDEYLAELRDKLLDLLSTAQTIEEVEDRLRKLYPDSKLVDFAIGQANKQRNETHKNYKIRNHSTSTSASFRGALQYITSFALAKVANIVIDGVVGNKSEKSDPLSKYKVALIRCIIDDVLNLAGDFVRRQKGNFIITRNDVRTAMHADKDLLDMFLSDDKSRQITENHPILAQINRPDTIFNSNNDVRKVTTYKQKVRSMVDSENSFVRCLQLIIKVFKAKLEELPRFKREVQIIFCNVDELLELSSLLLTALEDALESVGQEDEVPFVGSEILELAQAEEFYAYFTFAHELLSRDRRWRKAFNTIISDELTMMSIKTAGQSFDLAVRHLLPKYLLNTIIQFFEYFRNISELYELSKDYDNPDDELALQQTISILIKTKKAIEELLENEMDQDLIEPLDQKQAENIRISLGKRLESELQHERNLPLPYMPPPEIYRFSEPDSKDNIHFEDLQNRTISSKDANKCVYNENDRIPVIRCATLTKLVERLTYHKYQPNIVDSFLTTYRSFISDPEELLDLLIERFRIPDPPLSEVHPNFYGSPDDLPECDRTSYKQYIKRFRQEYTKPVKMRVINVLKSWIKNHYYDFERHPTLLKKLIAFLDEVYNNDKVLRGLIVSIKKSIEQKKISQDNDFEFMLSNEPPPILWHPARVNEPFDILTLHPIEFARQLTIIEFDLFRAIKPAELINARDIDSHPRKEDKAESSPNLSKMTRHFQFFSYWIRKCIVEAEDFDKRAAIYNRSIEIMGVLKELNNFTGLLCIGSAIESAPITRLKHTEKTRTKTTEKVLEEYNELIADHHKKLQRDLKHCNPPCIPFLGSYQTKLLHAKEGNKTFIDEVDTTTISPTLSNDDFHSPLSNSPATPISPKTPLPYRTPTNLNNPPLSATSTLQNQFFGPPKMINFTKQRIRAGLVAEISNYQNSPYCLRKQPQIHEYILSIEKEMEDFAKELCSMRNNSRDHNHSSEPSVAALTERLDYYLYEQSKRIEPKDCPKPPRSTSKLPDCWKSPGIYKNK